MLRTVTVLVNGLLDVDSGKTVMAYSLVKILSREGFNVVPFKPIGSVDIWRSSWVLREIEERRSIVSGDAVALKSAITRDMAIERINPVAIILTPIDPGRLGWSQRPYQNLMVNISKRSSLIRLTICRGTDFESYQFINVDALNRSPKVLRGAILDIITKLEPKAKEINDKDTEKLVQGSIAYAESCFVSFKTSGEVMIIESHDDTAVPIPSAVDVDIVIAVAPGKAGIVDGKKFGKAIKLLASVGATLTLNTREVLNVTNVIKEIDLPLLEYPLQEGYSEETLKDVVDLIKEIIKD